METVRIVRLITIAAALPAVSLPTAAVKASGSVVHESGCTVVLAQPEMPIERVDPLVPDRFTVLESSPGKTMVGPVMVHCDEVSVDDGPARETTWVGFRVGVDSNGGDLQGHQPIEPTLHLDDYQFFFASDNPEIIDLFRREIGVTDRQAVYVRDLVFDLNLEAGTFSVEAPAPTPSPFRIIDGRVGEPLAGPVDISVHHWGSGPHGVWKVVDPDGGPDRITVRLGPASGRIQAAPGSFMAEVFCSTDQPFNDPFAGTVSGPPSEFSVAMADGPDRPAGPSPQPVPCP